MLAFIFLYFPERFQEYFTAFEIWKEVVEPVEWVFEKLAQIYSSRSLRSVIDLAQ